MGTTQLTVFVASPEAPSDTAARAVAHARAAAGRFDDVEVSVVALSDPSALERGIGLEPTVMVDDLVVAVGQAPPAGHLVRALQVARSRETGHAC